MSGTPADPSMPQRQAVYLRALRRYRPEVEVYFGHKTIETGPGTDDAEIVGIVVGAIVGTRRTGE